MAGVFVNATSLGNLEKWTLSVDGQAAGGKKLAVKADGTLRVFPVGMILSIR